MKIPVKPGLKLRLAMRLLLIFSTLIYQTISNLKNCVKNGFDRVVKNRVLLWRSVYHRPCCSLYSGSDLKREILKINIILKLTLRTILVHFKIPPHNILIVMLFIK